MSSVALSLLVLVEIQVIVDGGVAEILLDVYRVHRDHTGRTQGSLIFELLAGSSMMLMLANE